MFMITLYSNYLFSINRNSYLFISFDYYIKITSQKDKILTHLLLKKSKFLKVVSPNALYHESFSCVM